MTMKAQALKDAVMARPGSSGNEGSPSEDVSENEGDNQSGLTLVTPSHGSSTLVHGADAYQTAVSVEDSQEENSGDDKSIGRPSGSKRGEKFKDKNANTKSASGDEDDGNLADNDKK